MPMNYSNADSPHTQRRSGPSRLWRTGRSTAPTRLVLYVRGKATNKPGRLYLTVSDASNHAAVVIHSDPMAVTRTAWIEWTIPLGVFVTSASVRPAIKQILIGVSNQDAPRAPSRKSLY